MEGTVVEIPAVANQTQNKTTSPWGTPSATVPCSLEDVMSEELAKDLQDKENLSCKTETEEDVDISQFLTDEDETTNNDFLLAQMLQHEFDMEHDNVLNKEEAKLNGTSKVKLSFTNYRTVHPSAQDEDSEEEPWEDDGKDVAAPKFNRRGVSGKGKNMVTKHDATICGKKNATKVMDTFPIEYATGDIKNEGMMLSNKVYNNLKKHSASEAKRATRLHEKKEHSTADQAVDPKTRLILYKLVNGEILEHVTGAISSGKESMVYHAVGGKMNDGLVPAECAIKVFKTTLTDFKNRSDYVRGDVRFFKDEFKKQNPRRIMKIWAQKEEFNLRRMEKYGIPCPRVVILRKHVLVMSFIGENQRAAPKLKEARLSVADMQMAYEQCIQNLKKMYRECGLVHSDLSEYNMLWHKDTLYYIDVSQAVEKMHPHAHEFLLRDCRNVCQFFTKQGVPNVPNCFELFNDITGLGLLGEGKEFLQQVDNYEKSEEKLRMGTGKDYSFDFYFEQAQKQNDSEKASRLQKVDTESSSDEDDEEAISADVEIKKTKLPSASGDFSLEPTADTQAAKTKTGDYVDNGLSSRT